MSKLLTWVIYTLAEPVTNAIRYVGWTIDLKARMRNHLYYARKYARTHCQRWIKRLLEDGKKPYVEIIEKGSGSDWPERERFWIKFYREQGADLVNHTLGGEGVSGRRSSPQEVDRSREAGIRRARSPDGYQALLRATRSSIRPGVTNSRAKLTEAIVEEIRAKAAAWPTDLRRYTPLPEREPDRTVVSLHNEGKSTVSIAAILNLNAIKPPRRKEWIASTVCQLLKKCGADTTPIYNKRLKELAKEYGVSRSTIWSLITHRSYTISKETKGLSVADVRLIREKADIARIDGRLPHGFTSRIAKDFAVNRHTIAAILKNTRWVGV